MLENLYTTKMSTDKEKLKTRLENIQREPKKKHTIAGLLVTLVLAAALAVGTICLAANETKAEDVTMTDDELALFLDQPLAPTMPGLDYADQEILVFHYKDALFVVDLANQFSFRYIFDLRDLNLSPITYTTAKGYAYFQLDVTQDGSKVYLSTGGEKEQAEVYDTYIVDLTTGQVKKGKLPRGTQFFQGQQESLETFPDLDGSQPLLSRFCIPVEDRTYYLSAGSGLVQDLQLVTRYDDGRPDKVWYLFGEPPYQPEEPVIYDSNVPDNVDSSSGGNQGEPSISDPPLMENGHSSNLNAQVDNYLSEQFSRVLASDFDIIDMDLNEWEPTGEDEATFRYVVTYRPEDPPEHIGNGLPPTGFFGTLSYPMKVTRDETGLTFYRDMGGIGGGEYTGPEWVPTDIQSLVSLP